MNYNNFLCVIPCCGTASRIGNIPKFLLPINNEKSLLKNHLDFCEKNNINTELIIRKDFTFLEEYLKSYNNILIKWRYTKTMSETVLNASKSSYYLLFMPDTFFNINSNDLIKMKKLLIDGNNVVLGLFNIRKEQKGKLGQVNVDKELNILDVVDKNPNCDYIYNWGIMLWDKTFHNKFIDKELSHVGCNLKKAIENGLKIKGYIMDSEYYDCGTFEEYLLLLNK